ncbi:MAG: hypothetical protein ILP01_00460, partial [Clostridia bacterium]|nr:hypothetical protein [Clostridia bacterium]
TVRRRVDMCPEEWSDTFGDDFYDYALDNSFYFLAPKTEWKADSKGVDVPGTQRLMIKTDEDLGNSMEILKYKVNNSDGQ